MAIKKMNACKILIFVCTLLSAESMQAQLEITSMLLNQYNVTSASLLQQVSVFNAGSSSVVNISATLKDQNGEIVLSTNLMEATLANGINLLSTVMQISNPIESSYGTTTIAAHVSTYHTLTTGSYTYCVEITPLTGNETPANNCELLEIIDDAIIYLIDPLHLDTIYTTTPTLVWGHNQAFSALGAEENFRLVLVKLTTGQDAATGIAENTPVFTANQIISHVLPFPQNTDALMLGGRYGWIVEKLFQGNVISTTDAWEFVVNPLSLESNINFAVIRAKNDNSFHPLIDGKLYIYFKERYNNQNTMDLIVRNPEGEIIEDSLFIEAFRPEILEDGVASDYGFNECFIDFRGHGLSDGYYNVEITIGKQEKYYVNTYVEQ